MASYAIVSVTLQSMIDDTNTAMALFDLQGGVTGELCYGEYAKLEIVFEKTSPGNISVGDRYVFNPVFFTDTPYVTPLQLGRGWVIDVLNYTGTGLFDVYLRTSNPLATTTQRNTKLVAERVSDSEMRLYFYFYATQDLFAYISDVPRANSQTLLSAAVGVPDLDNSTDSAYRRATTYLEFLLYHSDSTFLPSGTGDPYVRNPAAPTHKMCSYDIGARFLDNDIGATNVWSGGSLTKNTLLQFVNNVGAYKFADFQHKADPFLSNVHDDNFDSISFDGQEAILAKDSRNAVNFIIQRQAGFTVSKMVVRLWRVDSLISSQPFVSEYNIRTAELPASDATAYPNTIGTHSVFSTPASFSTGVAIILGAFSINGTQLVSDAEYRLWIGLYDNVADKASSHLTPPMRVATDGRAAVATLTFEGDTQTYEYDYPDKNNVLLALYQPFRAIMTAKAATYGGGAFAFDAQLQRVVCQYVDAPTGNIIAQSEYDYLNDVSATTGQNPQGNDPVMRKTLVGTDYTFDCLLRVPFSAALSPSNTEARWLFVFRTPNANGTFNTVSVLTTQVIRRKPVDLSRLIDISYADYAEYQIGNYLRVDTLCADVDKYMVRVEIDANPSNANVTALAVYGNPDGTEIVLEENGFMPTYLPLQQADPLSNVPTDFGTGTVVFFVLDISLFPRRSQYITVWALVQDI